MLSAVFWSTESFRTISTAAPLSSCIETSVLVYRFRTDSQTAFITCVSESLSNIPSQPNRIKSYYSSILHCLISGIAVSTRWLPPYLRLFASMSPKARETLSRPGKILKGPKINYSFRVFVCSSITFTKLYVLTSNRN
jgi:hypothetical protein